MRTWTLVAAALVLASAGTTAAVLPDTGPAARQQDQQWKRPAAPDTSDDDGAVRDVQRRIQVMGGEDVQIGVTIRDLEPDQARTMSGAVVADVREDSPAAKAGLKSGDVITEFDGERVRSARHLARLVGETATGRPAKVALQREGRRVDVLVTPETGMAFGGGNFYYRQMPDHEFELNGPNFDVPAMRGMLEEHAHGGPNSPDVMTWTAGRGRLGIGIQSLTPQLAEYFGTKAGVLVTSVDADSPAAKAGLKAGDVITAVGDTQVTSPTDVTHAVRRADEGADLSIGYTRDKKSATAKARIEPREREPMKRKGEPI